MKITTEIPNLRGCSGTRLSIGGKYIVAGEGPMELVGYCEDKGTVQLRTPGGGLHWAFPAQIVGEVSPDYLQNYVFEHQVRGLDIAACAAWLG